MYEYRVLKTRDKSKYEIIDMLFDNLRWHHVKFSQLSSN